MDNIIGQIRWKNTCRYLKEKSKSSILKIASPFLNVERVFGALSAHLRHTPRTKEQKDLEWLSPENLADQAVPEEHPYATVHHDTRVVGR